jgi:cytochrome c oxidase subunit 1
MVYATASIAILSFIVWAHHMYTTGMPVTGQLFFMYATMLIAVPTGVKIFNWMATMWRGSMTFETPMLWAVGFIFVFTMGGFTGLILSMAPIDIQLQDTYYVVAHFHYVLVAGSLFALFAGVYYWGPKWTGVMYRDARQDPLLGFADLLQRHLLPDALPRAWPACRAVMPTTRCSSPTSTCCLGRRLRLRPDAGVLLRLRRRADDARQGREGRRRSPGKAPKGLEWEVPSPAPWHTFETPPKLDATATAWSAEGADPHGRSERQRKANLRLA